MIVNCTDQYEIREAQETDAEEIAFVHWTTWQTAYKGIVEQSYLDHLSLADRLDLRKKILAENTGIHLVATFVMGNQVGIALCFLPRNQSNWLKQFSIVYFVTTNELLKIGSRIKS